MQQPRDPRVSGWARAFVDEETGEYLPPDDPPPIAHPRVVVGTERAEFARFVRAKQAQCRADSIRFRRLGWRGIGWGTAVMLVAFWLGPVPWLASVCLWIFGFWNLGRSIVEASLVGLESDDPNFRS